MLRKIGLSVLLLTVFSLSSYAQNAPDTSPHSSAQLIYDSTSQTLGFWLKLDPKWHTYWKNPGDSGLPVKFQFEKTAGVNFSELEWPTPMKIESAGVVTYGYEDELLVPFRVQGLTGPTNVQVKASWLVCEKACLPARETLNLVITPQSSSPATASKLFTEFTKKTPKDWKHSVRARVTDTGIEWKIENPENIRFIPQSTLFFIAQKHIVELNEPLKFEKNGKEIVFTQKKESDVSQWPMQVSGILKASPFNAYMISARLENAPPPQADTMKIKGGFAIWTALFFAFLGGILLNLMPCVLPVISIKTFGLIQHAENPAKIRFRGLLFLAGVLVSFWVLIAILFILRASGSTIGWGFQLQSPAFVSFLATLMFLMGLNLLGIFEFGSSLAQVSTKIKTHSDNAESFWSGVLTTLVSTPCSAPFMGTALGYALSQPIPVATLIFTSLGLGVAFPFTLISFAPRLSRFLPRPGIWMERLKQILALPLFATAAWLLWVFEMQTPAVLLRQMEISWAFLALAIAAYGPLGIKLFQKLKLARIFRRALILICLIGAVAIFPWKSMQSMPMTDGLASAQHGIWEAYDSQKLAMHLSRGKTVFVDFTAAWCLSCQVNKKLVLGNPEIEKAFQDAGIITMEADWTNENPEITKELRRLNRSGVPVYAFYRGEKIELLPEILTTEMVLKAIRTINQN